MDRPRSQAVRARLRAVCDARRAVRTANPTDVFGRLPPDLHTEVLTYLTTRDVATAARSCPAWHAAVYAQRHAFLARACLLPATAEVEAAVAAARDAWAAVMTAARGVRAAVDAVADCSRVDLPIHGAVAAAAAALKDTLQALVDAVHWPGGARKVVGCWPLGRWTMKEPRRPAGAEEYAASLVGRGIVALDAWAAAHSRISEVSRLRELPRVHRLLLRQVGDTVCPPQSREPWREMLARKAVMVALALPQGYARPFDDESVGMSVMVGRKRSIHHRAQTNLCLDMLTLVCAQPSELRRFIAAEIVSEAVGPRPGPFAFLGGQFLG
jgi:hypothetical protein